MYAIKQSYWNIKGNSWQRVLSKRYKTYQGAERTAARSYRWTCADPSTREVFEASSAEVVEVRQ